MLKERTTRIVEENNAVPALDGSSLDTDALDISQDLSIHCVNESHKSYNCTKPKQLISNNKMI